MCQYSLDKPPVPSIGHRLELVKITSLSTLSSKHHYHSIRDQTSTGHMHPSRILPVIFDVLTTKQSRARRARTVTYLFRRDRIRVASVKGQSKESVAVRVDGKALAADKVKVIVILCSTSRIYW